MNVTTPLHDTPPFTNASYCPEPPDTSNEFTVQNVVGIFLTLSLCLLTQPYGSLFFNPPPTSGKSFKTSQRLFFSWRLNPLACIAETVVIVFGLGQALRLALQDPHNTLPSISRRFPFYHAGTARSGNWRTHWHVHAAALLLIRANGECATGEVGVLERLTGDSLLRELDNDGVDPGVLSVGEDPHQVVDPAPQTEGVISTSGSPTASGDVQQEAPAGEASVSAAPSMTGGEPQPGILRRTTPQLEAGIPEESPQSDSDPEIPDNDRLADLRRILGSNVLAHKEKWVNLVTSFSVLVVVIKLAATILPWTVRVPAAFFLASWSSVQLLLYLVHLGELDERSVILVVKAIRFHRNHCLDPGAEGYLFWAICLVVAGPLGWLGYLAGFPNTQYQDIPYGADGSASNNTTGIPSGYAVYHVPAILPFLVTCMIFYLAFAMMTMIIFAVPHTLSPRVEDMGSSTIYILVIVSGIAIAGVLIGDTYLIGAALRHEGTNRVLRVLVGVVSLGGTCVLLFGLLYAPSRLDLPVSKEHQSVGPVVANTVISLYLFGELLFTYQSEGTYKPGWLELLG